MDALAITGGTPLRGTVRVSGAKNAALKLMAACLLLRDGASCVLRGVPRILDVLYMVELLESLGARVRWLGPHDLEVTAADTLEPRAPDHLVRAMRASVQVVGPVLARTGRARIAHPGGCDIGDRPIDLHLKGFQAMGARLTWEPGGTICLQVAPAGVLQGAEIVLDLPSVGATENLMTAAVLARGRTVIHNVAREPEVVELQEFLKAMGARIRGAGTPTIEVDGVEEVSGVTWDLMGDRIEAATWMVAAAVTRGEVVVEGVPVRHLQAVASALREAGAAVERAGDRDGHRDGLVVAMRRAPRPVSVRTGPFPGFPTDVQPQWVVLMTQAEGVSVVREEVHSHRFRYVQELARMGAQILVDGRMAVVHGPCRLTGARVEATDLRGGAALVLAALAAEGESHIEAAWHIWRGYEAMDRKLADLGANRVERVTA